MIPVGFDPVLLQKFTIERQTSILSVAQISGNVIRRYTLTLVSEEQKGTSMEVNQEPLLHMAE